MLDDRANCEEWEKEDDRCDQDECRVFPEADALAVSSVKDRDAEGCEPVDRKRGQRLPNETPPHTCPAVDGIFEAFSKGE